MKRFLTSRRGAAIEMAIAMMFLIIALTIILLTNGMLQASHAKDDLNDFEEKIALYEVGEYVVKNYDSFDNDNSPNPIKIGDRNTGYTSNYTSETNEIKKFTIKKGESVVLSIEIGTDGKITSWK